MSSTDCVCSLCIYIYIYIDICVCVCMHACVCVCMCVCTYMYISLHVNTVCVCVCVCLKLKPKAVSLLSVLSQLANFQLSLLLIVKLSVLSNQIIILWCLSEKCFIVYHLITSSNINICSSIIFIPELEDTWMLFRKYYIYLHGDMNRKRLICI